MTENQRYNAELVRAMNWLGTQDDTLFVGQAVRYAGTGMYDSLVQVPDAKKLEFPVAENFQMGYCTGLSLNGITPIAVYPRWNFLVCAADQIINHLDKLASMSDGHSRPKVIIRVAKGTENPVDPQDQHKGDFADAFQLMCQNIEIIRLKTPEQIVPAYKRAYEGFQSVILVEYPDYGKS